MKKKPISEMTAAGSVASVPMSMNEEPIKRAPPKKTTVKKKQWRNSLHEAQVSEADLSEQDLIITRGMGKRLRPGLMPRQSSHEAVEMALGDLLQCRKNARTIEQIIHSTNTSQIEPWVAEKLVKASDYLNTVAEYMEGQRAGQDDSMLTFEETEYSEDTYVICRKNKDGTTSYLTKHASKSDAQKTLDEMKKNPDCEYSIKKNPNIPGRKTVDEAKKKQRKEQVEEIAPAIGALGRMAVGAALGKLTSKKEEPKMESKLTRGVNILSELKAAEKENTGYTIVAESYVVELNATAVKTLLENYRRAINSVSETAVIKAFGDENKLEMILEHSGMILEAKDTEKMAQRWGKEMSAMTKEREAGRTNPKKLPPEILDRIARNPQDREEIIKGYEEKQAVKEGRKPKRVPKEDKPYAFGMAAAKKEAGITTRGKPVPKKVVKKAHKIAKAIKKDEK